MAQPRKAVVTTVRRVAIGSAPSARTDAGCPRRAGGPRSPRNKRRARRYHFGRRAQRVVRKVRFASHGRGKSGGARVIYYMDDEAPLFALLLYGKNE